MFMSLLNTDGLLTKYGREGKSGQDRNKAMGSLYVGI
jgi:hypothetical protein